MRWPWTHRAQNSISVDLDANSILVLECPDHLTSEQRNHLKEYTNRLGAIFAQPGIHVIVLEDGLKLRIVRRPYMNNDFNGRNGNGYQLLPQRVQINVAGDIWRNPPQPASYEPPDPPPPAAREARCEGQIPHRPRFYKEPQP